jgi:hypothetical protein
VTSPTRTLLLDAHTTAAPAMGRLSLILSSGRGLSPTGLDEMAGCLEQAATLLRSIIPARKEVA